MKRHWHKEAKSFHNKIKAEYDLSDDELSVLESTTDQLSNYWKSSDQLNLEGLTMTMDTGQIRKHPASEIAKNCFAGFLAGCRLLGVCQPTENKNRPGRPSGK